MSDKVKKIIIDPGHAPGNGNHGPTGYYEHLGMWKLSNYLKAALERSGLSVALTRAENEDPNLSTRGEKAKGADLFILEHSNAANGTARGVEVYYSVQVPGDKSFAAALSKAVAELMGNPDRGAKTRRSTDSASVDYYTVMASARRAGCPHVLLIESGFHDNAQDEAFLKADANLQTIAETQANVIRAYLSAESTGQGGTQMDTSGQTATPTTINGNPIMGEPVLTAEQLTEYLLSRNPSPKLSCTPFTLATHYIAEGKAEGVRGDIAFFQAMHETGWLKFGGQVSAEQNNYAGLGATNDGAKGAWFETPEYGVRAQIQHLKAYASKEPLNLACVDPRFKLVTRGCAPCWEDLNGRWAVPGPTYGQSILKLFNDAVWKYTGAVGTTNPTTTNPAKTNSSAADVEMAPFMINGKQYSLPRILLDGRNYVQLDALKQAGFSVAWDAPRNMPVVRTDFVR